MVVVHCPTTPILADILTKNVNSKLFNFFSNRILLLEDFNELFNIDNKEDVKIVLNNLIKCVSSKYISF